MTKFGMDVHTCCLRIIWPFLIPSCFAAKGNASPEPAKATRPTRTLIIGAAKFGSSYKLTSKLTVRTPQN